MTHPPHGAPTPTVGDLPLEALVRVASRSLTTPLAFLVHRGGAEPWRVVATAGVELPTEAIPALIAGVFQPGGAATACTSPWPACLGAPIYDALGHPRGALYVADPAPRAFTTDQRDALADLAVLATSLLAATDSESADSDARMRTVFDTLTEGVVFQLADGRIVACNPAAETVLGLSRDQILGRTSMDPRWQTIDGHGKPLPGDRHPGMITLRTGEPQTDVVMGVRKPAGELAWISVNARALWRTGEPQPYAVVATFRDITEQRASIARLTRHERLVTTGTLAAGIGHEINNPLTYVLGNLELALEHLRTAAPERHSITLREFINDAFAGAERIRKIVRGLSALVRDDGPVVPTDLRNSIDLASRMAMHELRRRATLTIDLGELPRVMADDARLTQVFVNLLVNAGQAFASDDPSHNRVQITATDLGEFIEVTVADNGPGIAADILPRIFDPFFTTKPVGRGTGLGLAVSHSIITAFGGEIRCDSEPGRGTRFYVRLANATPRRLTGRKEPSDASQQRARVLVVDDEEAVLTTIARALHGDCEVATESDPRQALQRFGRGDRFDVVLCDLMMPYLSGADLYAAVRELAPDQAERFVFITGGVLRPDIDRFLTTVPNVRYEKPLSLQTLRDLGRHSGPRADGRAAN